MSKFEGYILKYTLKNGDVVVRNSETITMEERLSLLKTHPNQVHSIEAMKTVHDISTTDGGFSISNPVGALPYDLSDMCTLLLSKFVKDCEIKGYGKVPAGHAYTLQMAEGEFPRLSKYQYGEGIDVLLSDNSIGLHVNGVGFIYGLGNAVHLNTIMERFQHDGHESILDDIIKGYCKPYIDGEELHLLSYGNHHCETKRPLDSFSELSDSHTKLMDELFSECHYWDLKFVVKK